MKDLELFSPSPKQWQFINDRHKYLAFGGARGGGKSHAVRLDAVIKALSCPGIKIMIVRKTYPELTSNHIRPMLEMLRCGTPDAVARYNDRDKTLTFPNGSLILFRYCDTDRDADRFQGTECDVLYVDEATQQPEERMKKLTACVRGVNPFPKLIRYTCNPGGEGHAWVKRQFIDRKYSPGEEPDEYCFIQSNVFDNKALLKADPDYLRQLEALPPALREIWLHGRWDVFRGQFFEEFRLEPDLHLARERGCADSADVLRKECRFVHVIEPFDLDRGPQANWTVFRSYDFGYNRPFSVGWWAVDFDGILYRFLELYGWNGTPNEGLRWTADAQFREVARIEREHPWLKGKRIEGVADPSIWDASHGESIAETGLKYGIYFKPGDNARIPGWMQCHYRLQFDDNGFPGMYVFSNCEAFIRTIPLMIYDEHCPEDMDSDLEDHVADEWRYACMSRPIRPVIPPKPVHLLIDPLEKRKTFLKSDRIWMR
ncbi:MAG: phage terminase large subunit [Oscillospiraceae bacterium]|nr:phage terminase large subunit [Oscillospiraceae bacterium]